MTLCPLRLTLDALDASPFPLDMTLIRAHCAVDGTDSDALLETYALAAIAWAEDTMHRTVFQRGHAWALGDFPRGDYRRIRLPRGRAVSVESVVYYDAATPQTLFGPSSGSPGDDFQEDLSSDDGGVIAPLVGIGDWPSVETQAISPVVINYTAGWQVDAIPMPILHAILFATSDMFDTRGSADLTVFGRNFETRTRLVSPYILDRWY